MTRRRWLFVMAPSLLAFVAFFIAPQVAFLRVSFQEYVGPAKSGGGPTFEGFRDVLGDSYYRKVIFQTLRLSTIVAVLATLISYPVATAIVRSPKSVGRLLFVIVVSSMFMSGVVRALGWQVMLGRTGIVNDFLQWAGVIDEPLTLAGSFSGVVIGMTHLLIPFVVLGMIPIIEAVPRSLLQAAYGLGASPSRTFFMVTLPMTIRGIIAPMLLAFALTAGAFTTPTLLGGGRVGVLSILIRQQTLNLLNYPRGAVLAVILLVVVFAVFLLGILFSGRRRRIPRRDRLTEEGALS